MRYRTTRRCDQDVVDIYLFGAATFAMNHADTYHKGLIKTFELLARLPKIARERRQVTPTVRLHRYQSHVVVYVEDEFGILIIRVLHRAQDWPRHLR